MSNALGYLEFTGYLHWRIALTLLVVVICALPAGGWIVRGVQRVLKAVGERTAIAMGVTFVVALAVVGALAIRRGMPLPYVHDEFSYLLAADTFASGRLTNPSPPAWEHFESMHILVRPTYQSKYPPGQGLMLALGQAAFGHPAWGAWISHALAAAAGVWMLRAFVPGAWALLGGLMLAIHPQMLEWGQRYWGGTVGVIGGLLLLGAAARIMWRRAGWGTGIAMGLGLLVLANSRPFEGFVAAVLIVGGMMIVLIRRPPPRWRGWLVPALVVLATGAAWMGYYNWRVTGNPLRLPYAEHQKQYAVVPLFIFQEKNPRPVYHSREMDLFHDREQGYWYQRRQWWPSIWEEVRKNIQRLYEGCLGNVEVLAVPLLILPWALWKDRKVRLLVAVLVLFWAALMAETFMFPHYAGPAAGVVLAITVVMMRWMWRADARIGRLLVRTMAGVFVLWSLFWWVAFFNWMQGERNWYVKRHEVETQLLGQREGKHLVLVRYGDHNVHEEWVYNRADITGAKVIWAREMPVAERNRRLIEQFPDRQVWLVEPEDWRDGPAPYPEPGSAR